MFIAEREGFEPPVPCSTTVFKTAAFDHSAISPGTKVLKNCDTPNFKPVFSQKKMAFYEKCRLKYLKYRFLYMAVMKS